MRICSFIRDAARILVHGVRNMNKQSITREYSKYIVQSKRKTKKKTSAYGMPIRHALR